MTATAQTNDLPGLFVPIVGTANVVTDEAERCYSLAIYSFGTTRNR